MNNPRSNNGNKHSSGFTLLEIVFVLGLIALVVTWLTLSVTTVETEQQLREAAGGIESMAHKARNVAVTQQRPYKLTITQGHISMAPQFLEAENLDEDRSESTFKEVVASEDTDPEVTYEIKHWRSDEWIAIQGNKKVELILDPVGLIEPISIRCRKGKSWLIQELHPLTANVRDEQMSIEKE